MHPFAFPNTTGSRLMLASGLAVALWVAAAAHAAEAERVVQDRSGKSILADQLLVYGMQKLLMEVIPDLGGTVTSMISSDSIYQVRFDAAGLDDLDFLISSLRRKGLRASYVPATNAETSAPAAPPATEPPPAPAP